MSRRVDYFDDPSAPAATSLIPGGSALVADDRGRILLQRRADSGNWSLPGGTMELGETLGDAVIRETREETGLNVELTGILGIYTDPRHVIAYADGEVRQEFVVAFTARTPGRAPEIAATASGSTGAARAVRGPAIEPGPAFVGRNG
ncbi:NUDIX domain-containing protein [Plantactinospora sp. WMMB334]|uniref:NUDIX domain-containing protein n=1 Tax=Plantactinospora sp. WMMB334 TaxID=3404119 RepID=UPI003B9329A5